MKDPAKTLQSLIDEQGWAWVFRCLASFAYDAGMRIEQQMLDQLAEERRLIQLARDHYGTEVRDNSRSDLIELGREQDDE